MLKNYYINHQKVKISMKKSNTIVQLKKFPQLNPKLKRRVVVGVRAFRKGGIRLQKQQIKDKSIIYNYGHGGAGISLAPACGMQAAELAVQASRSKHVSVVGSGIIGLMSALQCAKRGLQVTVYADRIPKPNQKNILNMITSQIAPGYWLPFHYQFSDYQQHKKRTEISYNAYLQWLKKSKHIYEVDCYEQMKPQKFKESTLQFIQKTSKNITLKLGNKQFQVIYFKTLQLHLQKFLQDLLSQCRSKSIKFQQKKFNTIQQLLSLKDDTIIACLGLNSKKIFKDDNIYGVKGHLVELESTTKLPAIFGFQFDGDLAFYCFEDKILIGLSRQRNEQITVNQDTVKMLQSRAYKFYQYIGLGKQPKAKL